VDLARALKDAVEDHERLRARGRLAVHRRQPPLDVLSRDVLKAHRAERP
jgi:hypothetical protein